MDKNKRNSQEKRVEEIVRTEFGMEFSGDMNASKIYEILSTENKKRENK
ncbi:hypothetical protein ACFY5J_09380 [Peribacillus butanolivorans]|jgi:hypothetical protein|nr:MULTISPECIES: hypothetical protein [Peribacillus]MBK5445684.1 hypothetical protein [Peribacillus sp. TH24]MBK5459600.1 hypothetical protein [Peribacillus sp. TH27]MBK5481409.1 hypothetical protein [Peribacillus sp. TH16]MBK5497789.1 hypothetical protein [Peribacillus sp. TH14]MCO0598452.1 hypothetical protein [Peribacillus butanolivorans]